MDPLENKVQKLIEIIDSAKKHDRNGNCYYIAGTPELTKALRELEIYVLKSRKEEQKVASM